MVLRRTLGLWIVGNRCGVIEFTEIVGKIFFELPKCTCNFIFFATLKPLVRANDFFVQNSQNIHVVTYIINMHYLQINYKIYHQEDGMGNE